MANNSEGFHYNTQNSWNAKDDLHNSSSLTYLPSVPHKQNLSYFNNEACLVIAVPPENRFRYRYDTEMSGTHGSLQGTRTGREKSVPTVKLLNFPFEALIRVTLVTCQKNGEYFPHPHSLFVKEKLYQKKVYINWEGKNLTKTGHYADPHYIRVGGAKNDFTAKFEGMCIINSKKEKFHSSVKEKLKQHYFEQKHDLYDNFTFDDNEDLNKRVETAVNCVDVDFVSLCFEAFKEENGKLYSICPPVCSEPIGNAKSAKTGKLKISRINKCSGSCKGGDEIWLLVEKINKKGLVVRFWEEINGKIIWESCIEGDELILHHQYAIIFKTPSYRDVNILSEVEVLMRLERTTQPNQPYDFSEPIFFVYEPIKNKTSKGDNLCRKESILTPGKQSLTKRARTDDCSSHFDCPYKRKSEYFEMESMNLEETDVDIDQLLTEMKNSFDFDQADSKFNIEEFLKFLAPEEHIQMDSVCHNTKISLHNFLYKMYRLYSKLDENNVKSLTEEISNFKMSKNEKKNGGEKDQVKDAASTLLTLRSKALVNNNNNNNTNSNTDVNNTTSDKGKNTAKQDEILTETGNLSSDKNSVATSVIKFNQPKTKISSNGEKTVKKFFIEDISDMEEVEEPFSFKLIKKEKESDGDLEIEKMERICSILNENGSWKALASAGNCLSAVLPAKQSLNPAKYIIECIQEIYGKLERETLRELLNSINEVKAAEILGKITPKN